MCCKQTLVSQFYITKHNSEIVNFDLGFKTMSANWFIGYNLYKFMLRIGL